jgi:type VII secretion protein EssB
MLKTRKRETNEITKKSEKSKKNKKSKDSAVEVEKNPTQAEQILVEENVKKSTLVCQTTFDLKKLNIPIPVFVPMDYEERLEEVCFKYKLEGLKPVSLLKNEEKTMQYRFLINFVKLWEAWNNYAIPLTEDNVYYDENYLPYVKCRDLHLQGKELITADFLDSYKTFIGGILGQKYSIKQLQESGLETLKDEPSFDEFYKATSSEELIIILRKRKGAYESNQEASRRLVTKTGYRIRTIVAIVAPILLLIALGGFVYSNLYVIPYQEQVINAKDAYIRMDFVAAIDSLHGISTENMSVSTKYILAVSFARGQSLQQEEISRIVSRLTVQSNERELEYWIYLGRLDVRRAQDLAMALSDNQLLVYAYMKELNILENDTSIPGEEKQNRINALEGRIRSLGERYTAEEIEDELNIGQDEELSEEDLENEL